MNVQQTSQSFLSQTQAPIGVYDPHLVPGLAAQPMKDTSKARQPFICGPVANYVQQPNAPIRVPSIPNTDYTRPGCDLHLLQAASIFLHPQPAQITERSQTTPDPPRYEPQFFQTAHVFSNSQTTAARYPVVPNLHCPRVGHLTVAPPTPTIPLDSQSALKHTFHFDAIKSRKPEADTQPEVVLSEDKPYKCSLCDFRSSNKANVKRHLANKHLDTEVTCSQCRQTLKNTKAFKKHMKEIHGVEKMYSCRLCNYTSKTASMLKIHETNHKEERPFRCHLCSFAAKRSSTLSEHVFSIHSNIRPLKCELCGFSCHKRTQLQKHMVKHNNSYDFKCPDCKFVTKCERYLKRHLFSTHSINKERFKCILCHYSTCMKSILNVHMKLKHSTDRPFSCTLCTYKAKSKSSLRAHIDRVHNKNIFSCDLCTFKCRSQDVLYSHTWKKHSESTKSSLFKCDLCSFISDSKDRFKRHEKRHSLQRPWACSQCNMRFTSKFVLDSHFVYKHSEKRRFLCTMCSYRAKFKRDLKIHMNKQHRVLSPIKPDKPTKRRKARVNSQNIELNTISSINNRDNDFNNDKIEIKQRRTRSSVKNKSIKSSENSLKLKENKKKHNNSRSSLKKPESRQRNAVINNSKSNNDQIKINNDKLCNRSNQIPCPLCEKQFNKAEDLGLHLIKEHCSVNKLAGSEKTTQLCPTCGFEFESDELLLAHVKFSHNQD